MARAGPDDLVPLRETLRQLRAIPQLRENPPGVFHLAGEAFVRFHVVGGELRADLAKASGPGFDAYPVSTAAGQRKLVDDAKRRAAQRMDDR